MNASVKDTRLLRKHIEHLCKKSNSSVQKTRTLILLMKESSYLFSLIDNLPNHTYLNGEIRLDYTILVYRY